MDYLVSLASRPVRYLASAVDDIKKEKDRYELSTPQYAMSREGVGSQSPNLHDPLLTKQYTRPKKWIPLNLRPFFTGGLIALMIVLAVATQALLAVSERRQGWRTNGIERFGGTNFLKSVVPVLLVMPITYLWTKTDESVRKMHAYVVLARGNAPVEKSILLNYTGGQFGTLFRSLRNRHWLVFFSSMLCVFNISLSPLASGLLTTRSAMVYTPNVQVQNKRAVGLNPTIDTLEFFVAASGYATAAAVHNLTDPPFVQAGWAAAEFVVPDQDDYRGTNGTVVVPTQAVQTQTGCGKAETLNLSGLDGAAQNASIGITGTWQGCSVSFSVPDLGMDQFGVTEVSGCTGAKANLATPYRPILFWVFSQELKQASLTFCQPSIRILDVLVRADLQTKLLVNVTLIGDYKAANNVTGMPQNGLAFNGIAFDIENSDPFVQARAASTRSGLPHAVYRTAEQHPGGIVKLMQTPNAIAELTDKVYLQFLSIVAKSTYFVAATNMINSQVDSSELRLYVYPTAAHSFTAALLLVAILGTCVHISHARARRNVYISLDPGTIGATISMSSHSTFISRLDAGYDEEDISKALNGMKFGISPRTWQISPRGEDGLDQVAAVQLPGSPSGRGKEVKDV